MKTRTGFVSNSSTTSFLVGQPKNADLKVILKIEVDLSRYVKESFSTETELREYFSDNYGSIFLKESWVMEKFNSALKAIQEGKAVVIMEFSNDDDPAGSYIYDNMSRKELEILLSTLSGVVLLAPDGD